VASRDGLEGVLQAAAADFQEKVVRPAFELWGRWVEEQRRLLAVLSRSAQLGVESGLLHADLDCDLLAFQIHGLMLGFHHARRLLRQRNAEAMARRSFEQLLAQAMPAR